LNGAILDNTNRLNIPTIVWIDIYIHALWLVGVLALIG